MSFYLDQRTYWTNFGCLSLSFLHISQITFNWRKISAKHVLRQKYWLAVLCSEFLYEGKVAFKAPTMITMDSLKLRQVINKRTTRCKRSPLYNRYLNLTIINIPPNLHCVFQAPCVEFNTATVARLPSLRTVPHPFLCTCTHINRLYCLSPSTLAFKKTPNETSGTQIRHYRNTKNLLGYYSFPVPSILRNLIRAKNCETSHSVEVD